MAIQRPLAGVLSRSLYENTSIAIHAHFRQRWLILFSLMQSRALLILILALILTAARTQAADERSLTYDQQVTLQGTLLKHYHSEWLDLLGDTSEARKRAKSPAYIVRLAAPVSVHGGSHGQDEEKNVREVYLALLPEGSDKFVDSLVGKQVTVTGRLDHANTVHHARPVMMDVKSIR